jgi:NAD(P)-dependent dehydrogenase (short-subunit alcohol dehydrogenase family)
MSERPVVLVTGAARRLGREIALDLARHGFDVAVHYRGSREAAEATVNDARQAGAYAESLGADLADEASCRALVPQVLSRFKRLDAVVNNASTFEYDDPEGFHYGSLQKHLLANTGPAVLLAQSLYRHLSGTGRHGCVVNLLDQKLWNQNPDFMSYTLSKAALEAANTMLALALAPQLRVVGVAPGLTITSHLMPQEKFERLHKLSPLGRSSSAADVVSAVKFALDNQSITGTTLLVDGGQHLMKFDRDFSLM